MTSMDHEALRRVGVSGSPAARAIALARLAKRAGLDGVVASAHEARAIRRACGSTFLIVVPGGAAGDRVCGRPIARRDTTRRDSLGCRLLGRWSADYWRT